MYAPEYQEVALESIVVDGAEVPFALIGDKIEGVPPFVAYGGISTTPHRSWGGLPEALGRHFIAIGVPEDNNYPHIPLIEHYAAVMGKAALEITTELYGGPVKADIAGWSWGGLAAQAVALQSRIRSEDVVNVNKLVVMASYPAGMTMFPEIPRLKNIRAAMAIMSADRNSLDPGIIYGGPFRDNEALSEQFRELIGRDIDGASHARQLIAAMMSGSLVFPNMMSRWSGNGPEALVMLGDDDPVILPKLAARLARNALMETCILEDEGHLFPVTSTSAPQLINEFLDRE